MVSSPSLALEKIHADRGAALDFWMIRKGVTLPELARLSRLDPHYLAQVKAGVAPLTPYNATRIAKVLKLSLGDLDRVPVTVSVPRVHVRKGGSQRADIERSVSARA